MFLSYLLVPEEFPEPGSNAAQLEFRFIGAGAVPGRCTSRVEIAIGLDDPQLRLHPHLGHLEEAGEQLGRDLQIGQ